ncbi:hypothetical protein JTB14_025349 [Gonioctena quinquepunctata]|nr:hypothetical protein JTB14_025349 [Gonioctena quinquepunctata]
MTRATARRLILNAKKTSWEEYISSINPEVGLGEIWRKIRVIAGKNTMDSPVSLNYDNRVISDPVEICEAFANHFAQNSCSDIYEEDFMNVKTYEERNILNFNTPHILHYNLPFSVNELDFALENCSEAAAGHDNILYSMIIHLPINEKLKLLELYNKIWDSGTYPKVWRIAIIIPILKPTKSPMDPNNYRPISLTSCLGKVFEKMVNLRFSWWIESNNLISQFQVGCRSRRSTTDALVFLESEIQDTFCNREHLVAVSFDLQKAYDRTWRFSIMQQLHTWGLRGNMAICIQSFLQDRTFQVRIGAIDSSYRTLDNGIPQGSVLSVSLFAVAINILLEKSQNYVKKVLYVDDLILLYRHKSMENINEHLNNEILTLDKLARSRGFLFSKEKTNCIHFCKLRLAHPDPELFIQDSLSAINTLEDPFTLNVWAIKILEINTNLTSTNKMVTIMWVPSHTNITGNELADSAAKDATTNMVDAGIPVPLEDVKKYVKQKFTEVWQNHWNEYDGQLRRIKPSIKKWFYPKELLERTS